MALNLAAIAIPISASVTGSEQVDRLTSSLRSMGHQGETSARQMANAMRQLPAQFQDVAVSLAGGQNPLMVLLQQGSQVATSFGGVGNALRGVMGAISPAMSGFALLAGSIGGVAAAYIAGYKESREFSRAMAMTGNFAGVTADSFERMAAAAAAASGATMASARGFLSAAVGTGDIGPAAVQSVGTAMTHVQRLTGATKDEVVKMFDGLTESASDWAVKTSRSFNFLSREQFTHIRQLEEQGRREEAIKYAVDAFTASLSTREVAIGSLERAWNALGNTVSWVADKLKSIGRTETLGEEMARLQAQLNTAMEMQRMMAQRGQTPPGDSPELKNLRGRIDALNEMSGLEEQQASIRAQAAAADKRGVEAAKKEEEERKKAEQEEMARAKQRAEMLTRADDEIYKLVAGERAYQILLGVRAGMSDDELRALLDRMNAAAALRTMEQMGEEERQRQAAARKLSDEETRRVVMDRMKVEAEGKQIVDENRTAIERLVQAEDRLAGFYRNGIIDLETYQRAIQKARDEYDNLGKKGENVMKDLAQAIDGWGKSSANAMADFVMGTQSSFRDLARSIIKDLIQMTLYASITKPLFGWFGKMLPSGAGQGTVYGDIWPSVIPVNASGGVVGPDGVVPLNRYARGGIATRPQLAMFGEGSMPEAYVPLPDGRSIPVTMQGGGDVVVNVNVESGSTEVRSNEGAGQLGRLVAGAVKAELINQKRPGGLLAA